MTTQADQDFAAWLTFHKPQLDAIKFPETLHRKLWQKLTFDEFDIGSNAKIIKDENEDTVDLICTKEMAANSNVFLVDHAWTFRYQDAVDTLKETPTLVDRLRKMVEDLEKRDLPQLEEKEEEKKEETTQSVETAFLDAINKGGKIFDLDNLEIKTLKNLHQFPETTEQISLFGNEIENPNDIAEVLVPLPNLKALWLNCNPVVELCSNFSMIADTMPKLEILNSQLTNKAGEWAISFYGQTQTGVSELDKIERLDMNAKGVLNMPSADVLGKLTSLKKLDLSNHPEFFMNEVQRAQMQQEALDGLDSKEGVTFVETLITIQDVLANLTPLEELTCGYQLEEYICTEREAKGFLPNLKVINGIDAAIVEMPARNKIRDALEIMEKLSLIAGVYVVGNGVNSQPVWYVNDEVGSLVSHSDTPNVRMHPFIHSPTNSLVEGADRLEVSIVWPIKDIKERQVFMKDSLYGFTEQKGFRSTRLYSTFDIPTDYFHAQLKSLRSQVPKMNVDQLSQNIQDESPLKGQIAAQGDGPIKVFTDEPEALSTLTDARFELVSDPDLAQIFWLIGANRNIYKGKSQAKDGYLNEFPNDDVLLLKDMFLPLVHSTYKSFEAKEAKDAASSSDQENLIPETYMVNTQLPAFVGRFLEREEALLDNIWAIVGGQIPQCAPVPPLLTNDVDWALRLTEAGPSASIIQKYLQKPMLTSDGRKMILRFSIFVKSIVPLQAFVSKKVQVLTAPKKFTAATSSLADEQVHLCSATAPDAFFDSLEDSQTVKDKSVNAIRSVLKAFQVQFGEEIKQAGEEKKRAIYSVDVQFDEAKEKAHILGFSFALADNLDYNEAFKALFFDEIADVVQI